jgi:hypothetical protein
VSINQAEIAAGQLTPGGVVVSNAAKRLVVAILPEVLGWNYQSFGVWDTATSTSTSGTINVASFGAMTPGNAIPTGGTGNYIGMSSGVYADSSGNPYFVSASFAANADFATRTVNFSTSNTQRGDLNTGIITADSSLNLSGTLSYQAATNNIQGNIAATGMSGTASARFYGPGAEEIGGTFQVSEAGRGNYMGAFGGKR